VVGAVGEVAEEEAEVGLEEAEVAEEEAEVGLEEAEEEAEGRLRSRSRS